MGMAGSFSKVRAITSSATTLTSRDNNTLFTNEGATQTIVLTLPAVASSQGLHFGFAGIVAQDLQVASAASNKIIALGDATNTTVTLTTTNQRIGGFFTVTGINNSKWLAVGVQGTLTAAS